jgi:HD-like signal output (HDOD) protein
MQGLDERTRDLIQRRVLKRVNDIPSLPQFVIDTLKKLDDPKSSAADVGERLSRDEGLVVRILRLANSAYYGLPRRITGVSEAIALLGFKTVKSIVLAASVYKFMDGSFSGYALDRGELWRHSPRWPSLPGGWRKSWAAWTTRRPTWPGWSTIWARSS